MRGGDQRDGLLLPVSLAGETPETGSRPGSNQLGHRMNKPLGAGFQHISRFFFDARPSARSEFVGAPHVAVELGHGERGQTMARCVQQAFVDQTRSRWTKLL